MYSWGFISSIALINLVAAISGFLLYRKKTNESYRIIGKSLVAYSAICLTLPFVGIYVTLLLFIAFAIFLDLKHRENLTRETGRLTSVVFFSLFTSYLVYSQQPGFSGCCGWEWGARNDVSIKAMIYLSPAYIAVLSGLLIAHKNPATSIVPLALFSITSLALSLTGILVHDASLNSIGLIIEDFNTTSFFTDALNIGPLAEILGKKYNYLEPASDLDIWLKHFDEVPRNIHSLTHPPGPIIFHYLIIQLAGNNAAFISGIVIGTLAMLGPVAIYYCSGLWEIDKITRTYVAGFYCLLPALRLFYPTFDQLLPLLTMLIIYFWVHTMRGKIYFSFITGLILFASSLFSYKVLVIGTFLACYFLYQLYKETHNKANLQKIALASSLTILTFIAGHAILHLVTGYKPVLAFTNSFTWQSVHETRSMLHAMYMNLYDFSLGLGFIPVLLTAFYLSDALGKHPQPFDRENRALSLIAVTTILVLHFSGLANWETARVWLLLQPLVLIPAIIVMRQWARPSIYITSGLLFINLTAISSSMILLKI